MKVYIAGALTGPKTQQKKKFYEDIAVICKECGIKPYVPHLKTDPVKHPQYTPQEIYNWNYQQITKSDFVIAYVGKPSLGVGSEIEIAKEKGVKVILLYEKDKPISRMVRGNPAVIFSIIFSSENQALKKLKKYLLIKQNPKNPQLYKYTDASNSFIEYARKVSQRSGCIKQATGAVIVKKGQIIGQGANAGKKVKVCPRVIKGSKTGEDYHLCREVCQQKGHSEVMAIYDAMQRNNNLQGANLYLWGHWWICIPCWRKILEADIKEVYLVKNSKKLFKYS